MVSEEQAEPSADSVAELANLREELRRRDADVVSEEQAEPSYDSVAKLANLQQELRRKDACISELERKLHESEERLQQNASLPGNVRLKAISKTKVRRSEKEASGQRRSVALQTAAARASDDFDLRLEERFQQLCRYTVAEKCGNSDKLFKTGWNKHSGLIRVLLPISSLRTIISSASSPQHAADLCRTRVTFTYDRSLVGTIWRLKEGLGVALFEAPLDAVLLVAKFELTLKFNTCVYCFALRPPGGQDREASNRDFLLAWRDLVIGAKTEQYRKLRKGEIEGPTLPWAFPKLDGFDDMPMVLWLQVHQRAERRQKRRCATRR